MGKKTQVTKTESGVVTGSAVRQRRFKWLPGHRLSVLLAVVVLLAAAGVRTGLTIRDQHQATAQAVAKRQAKYKTAKDSTQLAYAYAQGKDYTTAQKIIDDKISSITNDSDRAVAYLTQSTIAYNAAKYDDAKYYAQKAESLKPTDTTASLLGDIAMKQTNKTAAKAYYETAIKRLDKSLRSYPVRLSTYQAKVEAAK